MLQLLRVFVLHCLLVMAAFAQSTGTTVCHLGVAPLLGPCHSRERLMQLSVQHRSVLRLAVIQAGHNERVADQVVQMLCLGQATEVTLRNGTRLATMAWYGVDSSGYCGVHTLWNPELLLGDAVPCWQVKVTVESKTIIFVLPKACGNLARLGVCQRVTIRTELPPPYIPPPPRIVVMTWADAEDDTPDIGGYRYHGSTQSSGEIRFYPKPGDICVQGSTATSISSSSSSSNTGAININNQNNNINQAQNVVPVNVVVNTGSGNASGTATGTGNQDASGAQNNGP